MDDKEIVSALLTNLAERVGRERFELWFGAKLRLTICNGAIVVEAPNRFYLDWVRNNYRRELEAAVKEVLAPNANLEFRLTSSVADALATESAQSLLFPELNCEFVQQSSAPKRPDRKQLSSSVAKQSSAIATKHKNTDHSQSTAPLLANQQAIIEESIQAAWLGEAPADAALQVTPPNQNQNSQQNTLQNFVQSDSNRVAWTATQMFLQSPRDTSLVYLFGPSGTGKSHLLEGIAAAAKTRRTEANCLYLTAEQFTTQFLEALHNSGLPMFRKKYRHVDLLMIDDVHFFAGKRATVLELIHTIDTLLRGHKQVILTGDVAPQMLTEVGRELANRLSGSLTAKLDQPDYTSRIEIARRFASRLCVTVNEDILEYVAANFTQQVRMIQGAMQRLLIEERLLGQPLNVAQAELALRESVCRQSRGVKLPDIEKALCHALGLPDESLQSTRRTKSLNATRMLAMWLARKHTRAALTEIGEYFGRRSHSTVISAQKMVGSWVTGHQQVALGPQTWHIEEAIRRVEDKLRTGT